MMIVQGCYIRSFSSNHAPPPTWLGYAFCGIGLVGGILMPVSGFWLIFAQGIRLVWISKKAKVQ
jgi:Family of unknown function (DUF6463)